MHSPVNSEFMQLLTSISQRQVPVQHSSYSSLQHQAAQHNSSFWAPNDQKLPECCKHVTHKAHKVIDFQQKHNKNENSLNR